MPPTPEPLPPKNLSWHALSLQACLDAWDSSSPSGLSEQAAEKRLASYGPNALKKPERPGFLIQFASQFKSPLVLLLLAAGVASFALGESVDAMVIFAIVLLNAGIGAFQEYNAEKSIDALMALTSPKARVRREGETRMIAAENLVPGDWVELEAGDWVPADLRLIQTSALRCMEAALTGEPEGIAKNADMELPETSPLPERVNLAFQGTVIADGQALGLVVATGMATEIGRIAGLLHEADSGETTPLQKRIALFGRNMSLACLALVLIMAGLGLWRGMAPLELFLTAVSLAVAAVPEGLPAVVTIAMSLGVRRMAKRHALIRKLPAVETLGSASVICTDKTGTLTQGKMATRLLSVAEGRYSLSGASETQPGPDSGGFLGRGEGGAKPADIRALAEMHALCNHAGLHASGDTGDPTEVALLRSALELGIDPRASGTRQMAAFPFDSVRKRQSAWFQWTDGTRRLIVHGAPESVIELCAYVGRNIGGEPIGSPMDQAMKAKLLAENEDLASQGLRVLATAFRVMTPETEGDLPDRDESEADLIFAGFAGLRDPLRPEAREAVKECHDAGLAVVLITGDQSITARTIASDLGILGGNKQVVVGSEMDAMSEADLDARVRDIAVYARVTPEHKLRVVKAWRKTGAVTAMTGDGVNDAPALKGADIGIAMGLGGTEVAKQASDMVLADDRFATVVAAIEEGRTVYANIRNTLQYLLAGNTGELFLLVIALMIGLPVPLLPVHLLWINLLTDGFPALALAAERGEKNLMRRPPRSNKESLTGGGFLWQMVLTGMLTGGCALGVFAWTLPRHGLEEARSMAFAALVMAEVLRALGARSEMTPIWRLAWRGRWLLPLTVAGLLLLQFAAHHWNALRFILQTHPLSGQEWGILAVLGLLPLTCLEAIKWGRKPVLSP